MEGSCGGLVVEMVICSGGSQPTPSYCWAASRGLGAMSLKKAGLTDPRGEEAHPSTQSISVCTQNSFSNDLPNALSGPG